MQGLTGALGLVILPEPLPEARDLDAHNRVQAGIRLGGATQGIDCNGVLLDGFRGALEVFLADVGEDSRQGGRPA